MLLTTGDGTEIENPSPAQLERALRDLSGLGGDDFIIVDADDGTFMQALGGMSEGYIAEVHDNPGSGWRTHMSMTLAEATHAFVAFSHGDCDFAYSEPWQSISPPTARAPVTLTLPWLEPGLGFRLSFDGLMLTIFTVVAGVLVFGILSSQPDALPWRLPLWVAGGVVGALPYLARRTRSAGLWITLLSFVGLMFLGIVLGRLGLSAGVVIDLFIGLLAGFICAIAIAGWVRLIQHMGSKRA
ncbi:MAG: hypothetical protein JXE06_04395 [Coriobacteriia bacterium]|nr:hypothetical protein [Coriobacteriia bacterium]